jgi:hypothetical protein
MSDYHSKEVLEIFVARFERYLDPTEPVAIAVSDPELASWARGPGSEIAEWHFDAFTRVDDLVRLENVGKKNAINLVHAEYDKLGHAHQYDSFEAMYYQFKQNEIKRRRRKFAEEVTSGNRDEAIKQLFLLSLITDINLLFGRSE